MCVSPPASVYLCVCLHKIRLHACMYVCIHLHACLFVCVCVYVCVCVCVCAHAVGNPACQHTPRHTILFMLFTG